MVNEDTGDFLTVLFILFVCAWFIGIFLINLPKVIGSVTFSWIGKFPVNVFVFWILFVGGIALLMVIFHLFSRVLRRTNKNQIEN